MAGKREHDIAFVGLKPGVHQFQYEIKDKFFASFGQQDFKNVNALVKVELDKSNGFLLLKFDVGGSLELACDRCGNDLPMQLWDEFKLVVKLVDDPARMNDEEVDPDVFYIDRNESHLHLAEFLFEFVNLSIPITRMCAEEQIGGPHCNKEVLATLNNLKPGEHNAPAIWKDLEKFKNIDDN